MREFKADLHIHTCLSPCAELEMSPRNIAKEAKRKGLAIVGICDHNSGENVPAVNKAAAFEGVEVLGGMEITSKEEVHVLALFDSEERLFGLQKIVYENLQGTNDEKIYGDQVVANELDEVVDFNKKLLIGATEISIDRLVELIHEFDGLAIAAHIDREGFGIIGQLGFIPKGLALDAVELADPVNKDAMALEEPFAFVSSSDAHTLERIGKRWTTFLMNDVSIGELRKCLRGEDGRRAWM
ncbi:MAG: PHP domain-containing protein [Ignavibacteria bacterium]|nr:PHP domain-containing protein [Ignavibacteria bacterium]